MTNLELQLKDWQRIKQMCYDISSIPSELRETRRECLDKLSQELMTYKTMYKTKFDPFNEPR